MVSLILRPQGHTHSTLARYTDNENRAFYSTCKSRKPKIAQENDENCFGEKMKYCLLVVSAGVMNQVGFQLGAI